MGLAEVPARRAAERIQLSSRPMFDEETMGSMQASMSAGLADSLLRRRSDEEIEAFTADVWGSSEW